MEHKRVMIAGSTGMIGGLILKNCLESNDVSHVTAIVRRSSSNLHPKLVEIVHSDFLDYQAVGEYFKNQHVCFFCIGVYTGQVPRDEFIKITVEYPRAFCETLKMQSPGSSVCFLSGQGADQKEKSRILFAREKGKAENLLLKLNFKSTYIFRPGYIYPVIPRREPNLTYSLLRSLYKYVFAYVLPASGVTSEQLANAMTDVGLHGGDRLIYGHDDIRKYKGRPAMFLRQ